MREEMNSRHITILLILYFSSVICITVDNFLPYGPEHGDTRAPTNNDRSTPPIPISSLFPFFNHQHNSLIVSIQSIFARFISTYYFEMCTIKSQKKYFPHVKYIVFPTFSGTPKFTSGIQWGSCYSNFSFLCVCFVYHYWSFSFGHCVGCPSSIYGF